MSWSQATMGARFTDRLREAAEPIWAAQHAHLFIRGIAEGSLDAERFRHFMRQDYLFLVDYARVLSVASARAPTLHVATRFAALAHEVLTSELELHRQYATEWGVGADELERERKARTTRAYADFLLRTATIGEFGELVAAVLPCMWGYSELGRRLAGAAPGAVPRAAHPYSSWIATYGSEEFAELAAWCRELADDAAADLGPAGRGKMEEAFVVSSRYELAFWDMAWGLEPPE